MSTAIKLSKEYRDNKVLSLALTQKAMILRLQGEEELALNNFKLAAGFGNCFAKQQTVELNPYAALCNKMLSEVFSKLQQGKE